MHKFYVISMTLIHTFLFGSAVYVIVWCSKTQWAVPALLWATIMYLDILKRVYPDVKTYF
jgi:hypothetical protein